MRESDENSRTAIERSLFGTLRQYSSRPLESQEGDWQGQVLSTLISREKFEPFKNGLKRRLFSAFVMPERRSFAKTRLEAISAKISLSATLREVVDLLLPEIVLIVGSPKDDTSIDQKALNEESKLDLVLYCVSGRDAWLRKATNNSTLVRIFYASDRQGFVLTRNIRGYRSERNRNGELEFGECAVSMPACHKTGRLESPSILKLEFRPNPDRHIVLDRVASLDEERFLQRVSESVSTLPKKTLSSLFMATTSRFRPQLDEQVNSLMI